MHDLIIIPQQTVQVNHKTVSECSRITDSVIPIIMVTIVAKKTY